MKVFFLIPYPLVEAPSQRFRFEQYFSLLKKEGIKIYVYSFYNSSLWESLYQERRNLFKSFIFIWRCLLQSLRVVLVINADFVFIHREVLPVGPPILEWIIAKIFRKKIIYDFDDAIWATDKIDEPILQKILRWRSKVSSTCEWSYKVSCGNAYLCQYASQFNSNIVLNPTTIDTVSLHTLTAGAPKNKTDEIVIGWTGSHSTLKYLYELEPVIRHLEQLFPFLTFVVIANKKPQMNLKSLRYIPWSKDTEIEDLLMIDIGIMPLPEDEWSKGKCGFKALQYMALGIPAVVSPVGINKEIITHGVEGFLCASPSDWTSALTELILSKSLRVSMGMKGRERVVSSYSVSSNASNFLSLFQ